MHKFILYVSDSDNYLSLYVCVCVCVCVCVVRNKTVKAKCLCLYNSFVQADIKSLVIYFILSMALSVSISKLEMTQPGMQKKVYIPIQFDQNFTRVS